MIQSTEFLSRINHTESHWTVIKFLNFLVIWTLSIIYNNNAIKLSIKQCNIELYFSKYVDKTLRSTLRWISILISVLISRFTWNFFCRSFAKWSKTDVACQKFFLFFFKYFQYKRRLVETWRVSKATSAWWDLGNHYYLLYNY